MYNPCNIRLLSAENIYFMPVPEFVVMNALTIMTAANFIAWASFMMMNKGHPDAGDIAKVKDFVQEVLMKQA
jgi:hypothetical protein